jgi:hypothetical protein
MSTIGALLLLFAAALWIVADYAKHRMRQPRRNLANKLLKLGTLTK